MACKNSKAYNNQSQTRGYDPKGQKKISGVGDDSAGGGCHWGVSAWSWHENPAPVMLFPVLFFLFVCFPL